MTADKPDDPISDAELPVKRRRRLGNSHLPWSIMGCVSGAALAWGIGQQRIEIPQEAWKEGGYFVLILIAVLGLGYTGGKVGRWFGRKIDQLIDSVGTHLKKVDSSMEAQTESLQAMARATDSHATALDKSAKAYESMSEAMERLCRFNPADDRCKGGGGLHA